MKKAYAESSFETMLHFLILQWNRHRNLDHISISRWLPPISRQQQMISNVATPEVESTDIQQGF